MKADLELRLHLTKSLIGAVCCLGCHSASVKPINVDTLADLAPQTPPAKSAHLVLAGTSYPVSLQQTQTSTSLTLNWLSHGEVLESETYGTQGQVFGLQGADEVHFQPMLPLLKFPLHFGDSWSWTGSLVAAGMTRPATAQVTVDQDRIFVSGASIDTVKSTAEISIQSGSGKPPIKREVVFWFEPKAGIVKRQFGSASIREPAQ